MKDQITVKWNDKAEEMLEIRILLPAAQVDTLDRDPPSLLMCDLLDLAYVAAQRTIKLRNAQRSIIGEIKAVADGILDGSISKEGTDMLVTKIEAIVNDMRKGFIE